MSELEQLQTQWRALYSQTLPQLAKSRDTAQPKWPITLDHCFARIILDNVIGKGEQQWDKVLQKPAVKHMTEVQLRDAIALGEHIKAGKVDLCHLDEVSLRCRGKNKGKYGDGEEGNSRPENRPGKASAGRKRSHSETGTFLRTTKPKLEKGQSTLPFASSIQNRPTDPHNNSSSPADVEDLEQVLQRIQSHPSLTPYRKKLYTTLLSVPRGRYTTYAAMSDYLESSARAVGSGMRNNPFAPDVPCHRVLAANGSIGGFNGDWGKDGKFASKKIELLRSEGVRFDVSGKVVGEPFRKFHSFQDVG